MVPIGPQTDRATRAVASLLVGLGWSPAIASAAFLPSLPVVAVTEWLRLRGMTTNIALGGVTALGVWWLNMDFATASARANGALVVVLALGFVGGFCYWLVAGRNAGTWLDERRR